MSKNLSSHGNALSVRDGLLAILLQGIGPISYLALILLLSRIWGAEVQGSYAHAKAWLDFVVAFGAFGLSQGLTYVINRHGAHAWRLVRGTFWLATVMLGALVLTGMFSINDTLPLVPFSDFSSICLLATAGAAGILMNLWRGILLTQTDGPVFSLSFIVQPLALLAIVATLAITTRDLHLPTLFAITYCGGLLFVTGFLFRLLIQTNLSGSSEPGVGTLIRASLQAFIQNAAVALVPFISIRMLQHHDASLADIGIWSIAMAMFQIIGSPVAMLAPILFSRWSIGSKDSALVQAEHLAMRLFLWSLIPTLVLGLMSYSLIPLVFGSAFSEASLAASVLVASMPFVMLSRTIAPLMFASGFPGTLSMLYVIRLIVVILLGGILLDSDFATRFVALAISWFVAEALISVIAWIWLKASLLRQ